jgi:hypothetical protein
VYAHLIKPPNQVAAAQLENTIFSADSHQMVTKGWIADFMYSINAQIKALTHTKLI